MSELQNINVQETEHLTNSFNAIVQCLIEIRKEANITQQFMADWLQVDRRKIIALESGSSFDIILLSKYAYKLDVEIEISTCQPLLHD